MENLWCVPENSFGILDKVLRGVILVKRRDKDYADI